MIKRFQVDDSGLKPPLFLGTKKRFEINSTSQDCTTLFEHRLNLCLNCNRLWFREFYWSWESRKVKKRNDKKIWLTILMEWPLVSAKIRTFTSAKLTDSGAQGNINCTFRCGDLWKTTKDLCALKIENCICVRSLILFGSVSCVRDNELDPGLTKNNKTCLLSRTKACLDCLV